MSRLTIYAVAAILAVTLSTAYSDNVQCYVCGGGSTSLTGNNVGLDTGCNDPFKPPSNAPTCSNALSCYKYTTSVSGIASGTVVTRGCNYAVTTQSNGCSSSGGGIAGLASASTTTCQCSGNLCNAAARDTVKGISIIAAAALSLVAAVIAGRSM